MTLLAGLTTRLGSARVELRRTNHRYVSNKRFSANLRLNLECKRQNIDLRRRSYVTPHDAICGCVSNEVLRLTPLVLFIILGLSMPPRQQLNSTVLYMYCLINSMLRPPFTVKISLASFNSIFGSDHSKFSPSTFDYFSFKSCSFRLF